MRIFTNSTLPTYVFPRAALATGQHLTNPQNPNEAPLSILEQINLLDFSRLPLESAFYR